MSYSSWWLHIFRNTFLVQPLVGSEGRTPYKFYLTKEELLLFSTSIVDTLLHIFITVLLILLGKGSPFIILVSITDIVTVIVGAVLGAVYLSIYYKTISPWTGATDQPTGSSDRQTDRWEIMI